MRQVDHFLAGGESVPSTRKRQIWNPSTGEVQTEVALGDAALLDKAVATAKAVQPGWAATNPQKRARVMFKFKELIEQNMQELAELLSSEHGKVIDDAKGDVQRGLEVIEYACGIPQALKGEYTQGAGPGIDVYSMRQPLGIGAGIDTIEAGIRLRYEFAREFAPYIGIEQEWRLGNSRDFARKEGEDSSVTNYVIGVRFWF